MTGTMLALWTMARELTRAWRERRHWRCTLAAMGARELADIGLTGADRVAILEGWRRGPAREGDITLTQQDGGRARDLARPAWR
jgi:uncharacterized protein YjiS (DUF1127 family)